MDIDKQYSSYDHLISNYEEKPNQEFRFVEKNDNKKDIMWPNRAV